MSVSERFERTVNVHVAREWAEGDVHHSHPIADVVVEYEAKKNDGLPVPLDSDGIEHTVVVSLTNGYVNVRDWPLLRQAIDDAIAASLTPPPAPTATSLPDAGGE